MKKIIYLTAILASLYLTLHAVAFVPPDMSALMQGVYMAFGFFLLVFGSYGLYAEKLFKRFISEGKHENLCVEASYHVQKMGFPGKVLLFPFIKIKSSNSFVISFFGAITWLVIGLIIFQAISKG